MKNSKKKLVVFATIALFLILGLVSLGRVDTKASDPSLFATEFLQSFAKGDLTNAANYVRSDSHLKDISEMNKMRDFIVNRVGEEFLNQFKISEVAPVESIVDVKYFDKNSKEISYAEAFKNAQEEAETTQEYKDIIAQYGDAMKKFVDTKLKANQPIDPETERLANLGYAKLAELNSKFIIKEEEKKIMAYRVLVEFSVREDRKKEIYPNTTYPVTVDIDRMEDGTLKVTELEVPEGR
ncbi:MAG: hypothetical protein KBH94_06705 [Caldisericia bacterium]|nr:hypothetical protein [Caldisericia bacterium]